MLTIRNLFLWHNEKEAGVRLFFIFRDSLFFLAAALGNFGRFRLFGLSRLFDFLGRGRGIGSPYLLVGLHFAGVRRSGYFFRLRGAFRCRGLTGLILLFGFIGFVYAVGLVNFLVLFLMLALFGFVAFGFLISLFAFVFAENFIERVLYLVANLVFVLVAFALLSALLALLRLSGLLGTTLLAAGLLRSAALLTTAAAGLLGAAAALLAAATFLTDAELLLDGFDDVLVGLLHSAGLRTLLIGLTQLLGGLLNRILVAGLFGLSHLLQSLGESLGQLSALILALLLSALSATGFLYLTAELSGVLRASLLLLLLRTLLLNTLIGLHSTLGANLVLVYSYCTD